MKTQTKLTIPKDKIKGQRVGQLLFNSVRASLPRGQFDLNRNTGEKLFYLENQDLQKIIDEYLESL